MIGRYILAFAKLFIGFKYILGVKVPKNAENYTGAFDCAEFVAYCIYKTFGFLYGCDTANVLKAATTDAYTGFFANDAKKRGIIIPVEQAARTPGALLLRVSSSSNQIGHIVISQGNGKTVEAHSTKYGVIESKVDGRRWDYGILLPGVEYEYCIPVATKAPAKVYRLKNPMMKDGFISKIQKALGVQIDGFYGKDTEAAVVVFQRKSGLIPDGEVMPGGETAKALGIDQ